MMNTLRTLRTNNTSIWDNADDIRQIRDIFAPTLSTAEFKYFIKLGKSTGLNPFLREIWCIKYTSNLPAQIFIGRDGYRKAAVLHNLYDYHIVESVYSNDDFSVANGEINHKFSISNRGNLLGAYCIVKTKNSTKPTYVLVDVNEYNTTKSVWKDKPSTMIKKVAEAQGLRLAFPDILGGTYNEYESFKKNTDNDAKERITVLLNKRESNNEINASPKDPENVLYTSQINEVAIEERQDEGYEYEIRDSDEGNEDNEKIEGVVEDKINIDLLDEILFMIDEKKIGKDRVDKALSYFKVSSFEDLTISKCKKFILMLNKI